MAMRARGRGSMARGLAAALALAAGCGDSSGNLPPGDAGRDAANALGIPEPPLPARPAPPGLTPCPSGWRETVGAETDERVCEPWPETGRETCAAEGAHFPGEVGCAALGTDCPEDGWPAGLPADVPVLYVRAGAPSGGTGTRDAPLRTIAAATAVARPGTIVAVAAGTYAEPVELRAGTTVWGACTAGTVVRVPAGWAGIYSMATDTAARNLRTTGGLHGVAINGGSLHLEDVLVERTSGAGVNAGAGTLTARTFVLREAGERGVMASAGAQLDLERVAIVDATAASLAAYTPGTTIRVRDAVVVGGARAAVACLAGGRVELERVVAEGASVTGLVAEDADSTLVASDVVVRGTRPDATGAFGWGVAAFGGARADLTRALVEGNRDFQVVALEDGSVVSLTDAVVRDPGEGTVGLGTNGVTVQHGGRVELTRTLVARHPDMAVRAVAQAGEPEAAPSVHLVDVVLRDVAAREDGTFGQGLFAQRAVVTGERVLVERAHLVGIVVRDVGATLELTDVTLRETLPVGAIDVAHGLALHHDAVGTVHRLLVDTAVDVGLDVFERGVLDVEDLTLRDTRARVGGYAGFGVSAASGSTLRIARALVSGGETAGVIAYDASQVTLRDAIVQDTRAARCGDPPTPCPSGRGLGNGLVVATGGRLEATRFVVTRSALCGVAVIEGEMDLHDGEVSGGAIGANVPAGYDIGRLSDRVRFVDNDRMLDSNALPTPDPVVHLTGAP